MRLLILCTLFQLVYSKVNLPGPSGPCQVEARSAELVDTSRIDPFSPNRNAMRAIMVTSFVPVHCGEVQYESYLPPKIAQAGTQMLNLPNGTLESIQLGSWSSGEHSRRNETQEYPVIIFSPGLSASRLIYANLLENVASNGFAVVSVDHPYDAAAVEFPDGRIVVGKANMSDIPLAVDTRVRDVIFALNELSNNTKSIIPPSFPSKLQLDRVALIGHSLGGATAAQAVLNDTRFAGGINFDGSLHGSVIQQGLDRPFINFGQASLADPGYNTWNETWPHLRDFKLQLQLKDSLHLTFSDLPVVFDSAPSAKALRNATARTLGSLPGLGTLPGLRVRTILTDYIMEASRFFLRGKKSAILRGPSSAYPEVMYVRT